MTNKELVRFNIHAFIAWLQRADDCVSRMSNDQASELVYSIIVQSMDCKDFALKCGFEDNIT